jgi:hypothetical protein
VTGLVNPSTAASLTFPRWNFCKPPVL